MKKNTKKIIGTIIDWCCIVIILIFIFTYIYNIVIENISVKKENTKENLVVSEREIQYMEYISEKIYKAFTENNKDNVKVMLGNFYKISNQEMIDIGNQLKVNYEEVDAKAIETHEISKDIFRTNIIYQDGQNVSYKNDGKINTFVIKLDRKLETFKILDIKVGV